MGYLGMMRQVAHHPQLFYPKLEMKRCNYGYQWERLEIYL